MKNFMQILNGLFFFFTIIVGIIFLRGDLLFSPGVFKILQTCIMPMYLVITGITMGSLVAKYQDKGDGNTKIYTKSFIVGVIVGSILALIYIIL